MNKGRDWYITVKVLIIIAIFVGMYLYRITGNIKIAVIAALAVFIVKPAFRKVKRQIKKRRYIKSPLSKVDRMEGHEFEEYLQAHFQRLGYRCKLVGAHGHDYGVDLIVKKDGISTAVQAKRYDGLVGIKAVQEIVSGRAYYDCDKAMVVTNSMFTKPAWELAAKCEVELIDRSKLTKMLK